MCCHERFPDGTVSASPRLHDLLRSPHEQLKVQSASFIFMVFLSQTSTLDLQFVFIYSRNQTSHVRCSKKNTRVDSGVLRVARGGCRAKAPLLAARPDTQFKLSKGGKSWLTAQESGGLGLKTKRTEKK